ncbi:hypothetical protein Mmc1_1715 [Magnetococcus marinus MC-1]|uniref:Uncharacterized protein n=1 Tax=Magnetococcus marinus (strain ATCC BAA-1437 / JCM 17883 / MC-1) TaxID=156889 RepID=A0L8D0_MAGMM|nr:hypothetical protein [Magnetococcus marinus]ABK44223.1 hypothetical protein Mmc1_1715 [Magnetococcus marinus MC-1]
MREQDKQVERLEYGGGFSGMSGTGMQRQQSEGSGLVYTAHDPPPNKDTPQPVPRGWRKAEVLLFHALPGEVKQVILRREKELERGLHQKAQQLRHWRERYAPFEAIIQHYQPLFESHQISPSQAFAELLVWRQQLNEDPEAFVEKIGVQFGLDMQIIESPQEEPEQVAQDPRLRRMEQAIELLNQRLQFQERRLQGMG